jgi:hypothetical protein
MSNILPLAVIHGESGPRTAYRGVARISGTDVVRISGTSKSHPSGSAVYALTEGAGLYVSRDGGANWSRSGYSSFALDLLLDRSHPNRLYGGEMVHGGRPGGAFASTNDGEEFHEIGLNGEIVGSLATDGTGSTLFAACYQAGVFWAQVPNRP